MSKLTELCDWALSKDRIAGDLSDNHYNIERLARAAKVMEDELREISDPMENNPYRLSIEKTLAEAEKIVSERHDWEM